MNRKMIFRSRWIGRLAAAVVLVAGLAVNGQAAPLNLVPGIPDITATDLALKYDGVDFTAIHTGTSIFSAVDGSGNPVGITSGSYSLSIPVDSMGLLNGPGGTLSIMGDIGSGVETLLAGTIFEFGFDDSANAVGAGVFEALLNVTMSAATLGYGSTAGINISSFPGSLSSGWSFGSSFTGTGTTSDNFSPAAAVPEPASITLLLLGVGGLAALRRLRRSRRGSA